MEGRPSTSPRLDRVLSPDYVRGLSGLALRQVRARRDEAAQEETDLSYVRRILHARIDIVRAEQRRRQQGGTGSVLVDLTRILAANALAPATGSGRFQTLEPSRAASHRRQVEGLVSDVDLSDVGSCTDEQLQLALEAYSAEEASVSRRRREVQQVVDTLNAEIGARYARGDASVDDLLAEQTRAAAETGDSSPGAVPMPPDDWPGGLDGAPR